MDNIKIIEYNNDTYYIARSIGNLLGYKDSKKAVKEHISEYNKKSISEICLDVNFKNSFKNIHPQTILINKNGVKELIIKSRMPQKEDIAKLFNIDIINSSCMRKEQDTIRAIMKAFKSENMLFQYSIGKYRIDLYFTDYNLAIECDENGHKDRNIKKEIKRENFIKKNLKCKFIRYNPDDDSFDIYDIINRIFLYIKDYINNPQ